MGTKLGKTRTENVAMPGMFEKDLIEIVHYLLQAYPPCPPWSGNAILVLHVFRIRLFFVLKGRNFHIISAALSAILFSYSSQALTPF